MSLLAWSSMFSVGVAEIDNQHKKLVDMANKLNDAMKSGQGKEALYKSAIGGKNAMPPKGGAADLSDAEIKGAVDHLLGLSK